METATTGPLGRVVIIAFALLTTDNSIIVAKGMHKMENCLYFAMQLLATQKCSQSYKGFYSFFFLSGKHGTSTFASIYK